MSNLISSLMIEVSITLNKSFSHLQKILAYRALLYKYLLFLDVENFPRQRSAPQCTKLHKHILLYQLSLTSFTPAASQVSLINVSKS